MVRIVSEKETPYWARYVNPEIWKKHGLSTKKTPMGPKGDHMLYARRGTIFHNMVCRFLEQYNLRLDDYNSRLQYYTILECAENAYGFKLEDVNHE